MDSVFLFHCYCTFYSISHSSPARHKSSDKVSPPQRPPPPKFRTVTSQPDISTNSITPSVDVSSKKPKPPIRTRTRKKKFFAEEARQNSRQSEFVELSTSDVVVELVGQEEEIRAVEPVETTQENRLDTVTEDKLPEENEENVEDERQEDGKPSAVEEIELDRDDWEVISDGAAEDESRQVIMDEPCLQPNGYVFKMVRLSSVSTCWPCLHE